MKAGFVSTLRALSLILLLAGCTGKERGDAIAGVVKHEGNAFLIGRSDLAGFMTQTGVITSEPRFGMVGQWLYGYRWALEANEELLGYFIDGEGRPVNKKPVGDTGDFIRPAPYFINDTAVVRATPERFVYLNSDGTLGAETLANLAFEHDSPFGTRVAVTNGTCVLETPDRQRLGEGVYDQIYNVLTSRLIGISYQGLWGFVDHNGAMVVEPQFQEIESIYRRQQSLTHWLVKRDGHYGLLNRDGKTVFPCSARVIEITEFHGDEARFQMDSGWGVFSLARDRIVVPPTFEAVGPTSDDSAWVMERGKWGLIDYNGKVLCEPVYDTVRHLSTLEPQPCWIVGKANAEGLANLRGDEVLAPDLTNSEFWLLANDLVCVRGPQGWGIFSAGQRRYTVPRRFGWVSKVTVGGKIVGVRDKQKWSLLNAETGTVLHSEFADVNGWQGLVVAWRGTHAVLFDAEGRSVIPLDAKITELPPGTEPLLNGVGKIVCAGKAGLIAKDGRIALACRYEDVGNLSEGLVAAKQDGRWGYVNLSGEWVVPPRFEETGTFRDGFAVVRLDGKVGLIGKNGAIRVPCQFADAGYVLDGRFPAARELDGKLLWGIVDLHGQFILPLDYDCVEWIDLAPGSTRYHGKPGWMEF